MGNHLITWIIILPVFGALLQGLLPAKENAGYARWLSLGSSALAGLLGLILIYLMNAGTADSQFAESFSWVGSYSISYQVGIDGLNVVGVILASILFPALIASEWKQASGQRGMNGLFLLLQSALFGTYLAQDLFLQFFFWALTAIPFYFLIGIWGGDNRETAAFRTTVSASLGNALVFLALILVFYSVDPHTFSLAELSGGKLTGEKLGLFGLELPISVCAFALVAAGVTLRMPIWPLHGWFTSAAEEAPPSALVALAGAVVPASQYLFIRLAYSLFPDMLQSAAPWIVIIGIVNLVMGGLCAVSQTSLRGLLAFLCLSQVGLVLLGVGSLNSAGLVGAVYQTLTFGLALAGFGLLIGMMIERTGQAEFLNEKGQRVFGGIALKAPVVALTAGVLISSLLGIPGVGGFVGQALVMIGTYTVHPVTVLVIAGSLVMGSYCLMMAYRWIFLGKPAADARDFPDLTWRERACLLPIVGGLIVLGVYPKPLLDLVRPTVLTLLSTVK